MSHIHQWSTLIVTKFVDVGGIGMESFITIPTLSTKNLKKMRNSPFIHPCQNPIAFRPSINLLMLQLMTVATLSRKGQRCT